MTLVDCQVRERITNRAMFLEFCSAKCERPDVLRTIVVIQAQRVLEFRGIAGQVTTIDGHFTTSSVATNARESARRTLPKVSLCGNAAY